MTVYNYDIAGNVRDYTEKENSTTILTVNNTYDQNGRLATREETTQGLVATHSIRYEDGDVNDEAVEAFLVGNLGYNPDVSSHHDHEHGEHGHTCGDHD